MPLHLHTKTTSGGGTDLTRLEELSGEILVQSYGEITTIASVTETLITSFTVGAGKVVRVKGCTGSGTGCATFRLYVNSVQKYEGRIVWTERNINPIIEVEALAGELVELKVEHDDTGKTYDFQGSIYGYEFTP